jgi:hypothetical protein
MTKGERLALFYERLQAATAASSHDEAYALLCSTLNAVENEHSGVPFNPDNWQTDGRMYPPQQDRASRVEGFPEVIRYGSFRHNTFIASNGAIEVRIIATDAVHFVKPGANGKGVWG